MMIRPPAFKRALRSGSVEYFYWIFFAITATVAILGMALYFSFAAVLKKQAIDKNVSVLSQLERAQEAVLNETSKSIGAVVLDTMIDNYMDYYGSNDIGMMLASQSKLESVLNLNDSLDSVYVVYEDSGRVLSADSGGLAADAYYDYAFIKGLDSVTANRVVAREKPDFATGQPVRVVSFIHTIPIVTAEKPKALVVFNLRSAALQQTLDAIKMSQNSAILILDSDGNCISQKSGGEKDVDKKLAAVIQQHSGQASGFFFTQLDRKQTLVSYVDSTTYGWRYVYLTPMASIMSGIRFLQVITLLSCTVMLALGLLGSLFLSKKLYGPIRASLWLFNPGMESGSEKIKETALLQNNINNMLRKNKNLEDMLKEYDEYQRENFLFSLLENTDEETHDSLVERLGYYHVDLYLDGFFVAMMISVDDCQQAFQHYSEKQVNMFSLYSRENIADKVLTAHRGFLVGKVKSGFFLVVNFPALSLPEQMQIQIQDILVSVRDLMGRNVHFTFTIGISMPHAGVETLPECREEAARAVNHRLLSGYNSTIFFESLTEEHPDLAAYPFPIERKLLDAVKSGNQIDTVRNIDAFTAYLSKMRSQDMELVRYYFLQLLTASVKCFYEIDRNFSSAFVQKEYYTAILKEETIQKMSTLIKSLYSGFLNYIGGLRRVREDKYKRETVHRLTEFICSHLDGDLSLEFLADQFQLSIYQLRRLFRDELKISPKDYIDELKVKRAAELLRTTDIKIGKIAEMVGYFSFSSFIHTFKTAMGKTPGEYRQDTSQNP